nr:uncharacterized protein LOC119173623 [Rhipicephalus microplus]
MATKTLEERRKAYFAYVRYVQSIAVLRQSKAKARNAKKEKEAMIQKFIEMVRDTLKQAKEQIWRRACFKKLIAHKDDLENMQGGIEHVAVSLEEQNKKVAEAGYVAIKTVKPIDKEGYRQIMSHFQLERNWDQQLPVQLVMVPIGGQLQCNWDQLPTVSS